MPGLGPTAITHLIHQPALPSDPGQRRDRSRTGRWHASFAGANATSARYSATLGPDRCHRLPADLDLRRYPHRSAWLPATPQHIRGRPRRAPDRPGRADQVGCPDSRSCTVPDQGCRVAPAAAVLDSRQWPRSTPVSPREGTDRHPPLSQRHPHAVHRRRPATQRPSHTT